MTDTRWLVLDSSFLVYRAQYAMAKQGEDGDAIIALISTMMSLRERFDSSNFVFCFDMHPLKRSKILPTYKERDRTPEHEIEHKKAQGIMQLLRTESLEQFGFKNILFQQGYEADDIIASVVQNSIDFDTGESAVIISTDNDMHQLLRGEDVVIYNPNKETILNERSFVSNWNGLSPESWPCVKAIAGCRSDNVAGVDGVGEKTAAKFVLGSLDKGSSAAIKIRTMTPEQYKLNYKLVKLPYSGVQVFDLHTEEKINWRRVSNYGSKTITKENEYG